MSKRPAMLVGALVVLLSLSASSASALQKPRVFTLLEVERAEVPLGGFTGDRPPAAGDQFVATNTVYRWTGKRGARVGHDRVLFTFMNGFGANFTHRATVLFDAQVYLPDGSVFVGGYGSLRPDGPQRLELPVLGGTGVYDNVRGHVSVRDNGRRTLLEFHLTP